MCVHRPNRAQEAYDLSIAQKPPKTVPLAKRFRVAIAARHIDVANTLPVSVVIRELGGATAFLKQLTGSVLNAAHDVRDHLRAVATAWDEQKDSEQLARPDMGTEMPSTPFARPRIRRVAACEDIDAWIDGTQRLDRRRLRSEAGAPGGTADWNAFVAWNADRLERAHRSCWRTQSVMRSRRSREIAASA